MSAPALHFRRVQVRRMPGVDGAGFTVDALSAGINVVYGPNGCGKSRTAHAINMLLWPGGTERASLSGLASLEGQDWRIDLDAGSVRYQRGGTDSVPPHLPSSDARDRYNLPLHELLHDDSADFAETILRESAGGYDLKLLAQAVGAREGASGQGKELAAVKQSAARLKEAEEVQRKLLDEELRLAELEQALARAREAAGRADVLRKAIALRDAAGALEAEKALLGQYDAGIDRLRGDELRVLDGLRKESREAQATLERCRDELARAAEAVRASGVGGEGVPEAVLKGVAARSQRLTDLRSELDTAGRERDAAEPERAKARGRIAAAVTDEQIARVDAAGLGDVEAFARELLAARAQSQAHDALAEWVGKSAPPADLGQASYGLRVLWRWLQTTPPESSGPAPDAKERLPILIAAAVIAAEALLLAATVHWAFAAVVVVAVMLLVLSRRAPAVQRDDAREAVAGEFLKLGLAGPPQWTADEVAAAADRLAREVAAARVEEEKAARWEGLQFRREQHEAALKRLEVRRHFIAAHLGVPPDTDALSLVALASNVARWQDADARAAGAAAKYDGVLERYHDEVATAAALLRDHGFEVRDAPDVSAAVDTLRERQKQFELASQREAAAAARLTDAERQAAHAAAQVAALFNGLGLEDGDDAGLRRWCAQRAGYLETHQRVARAAVAVQMAEAALAGDGVLRAAPREQVERELREAEDEAARVTSLHAEAVAIGTRISDAKKSADVEEALARHGENLAALAARRDDDAAAVAAWVLVEHLRTENRDRHRPAVFHRARKLFSSVTQGRYRLEFDDGAEAPSFRAVDTSDGTGHSLEELSSGTRLQLLLAVRVAFVEEQESGVKLPILLDETLANSDETRARSIIDATIAIARSGRQVFYFTAQLDEVAKWKAILEREGDVPHRMIDLAEVRGLAASERLPLRDVVPLALPKVPEPVGLSRREYAALLQVPAFDPSRPEVGGTHLWHFIDDPFVLHQFLTLGVHTWGQLRTLGSYSSDTLVNGSADAYHKAGAAAKALEALADAWRVGRGRPVDRQVLEDSDAVSDRFIEPVSALLGAVGNDGARLVEALEDGQVKGFRRDAIGALRTYLAEYGFIDDRPRVPMDQIKVRMLAAVAEDVAHGRFDAGRIDEYLAACTSVPPTD